MPMSTVHGGEDASSSLMKQWSCDICKGAVFDDFKVALHHEARCRLRRKREMQPIPDRQEEEEKRWVPRQIICVKRIPGTASLASHSLDTTTPTLPTTTTTSSLELENKTPPQCLPVKSRMETPARFQSRYSTSMFENHDGPSSRKYRLDSTTTPRHRSATATQDVDPNKVVKGAKWVCDVCQVAKFVRYVDAYKHEKICSGVRNDGGERRLSALDVDETDFRKEDHENRALSPKSAGLANGLFVPSRNAITTTSPRRNKKGSLKWLCGVCEIACFDSYEKALRHEKLCEARHNGGKRSPFSDRHLLTAEEYYN